MALDGAGWHPAAWREPAARPAELFTAGYWADLAAEAERGLLDFITIEDALAIQSAAIQSAAIQSAGIQSADRPGGGVDDRTDQVRGRLDAVLIAARVAPLTRHIGLIPTGTMTHTEPFHMSTALATLDYVSQGRAGWRAQLSSRPEQAAHFGRGEQPMGERFAEGADFAEVVRLLWDSWEDDAVIRDVGTGRFVDRDKLHYIDFEGRWFSVRGPSITPRPPQGQLPVAALAHTRVPYEFAARAADIVFVTPGDADHAARIVGQVKTAEKDTERAREPLHVYADLTVFLDEDQDEARERKERLDQADGARYGSDSAIFMGTAGQLANLLLDWRTAGLDGFRLRPGALPHDLEQVTRRLVPALQGRGVFRTAYAEETLRGRLGLRPHPASRYVHARKAG